MEIEYKILNQITPENVNPYSTPVGYFDGLASEILFKIQTNQETYKVPLSYFTDLSNSILAKIKQKENETFEELKNVAPLLNTISRANVYNTPNGYFENFETVKQTSTKVVSIQKSPAKWFKYAVAAAIAGVIGVSASFLFEKSDNLMPDFQASLQNISDTILSKEIDNDKLSFVSNEETTTLPWQTLADLQEEIKFVTDEEMDFYLKENNITEDGVNNPNS